MWQKIPEFCITVDTFASFANHVVKRVCVENIEEFLNNLWRQEGSFQRVPFIYEVFVFYKFIVFIECQKGELLPFMCVLNDTGEITTREEILKKVFGIGQLIWEKALQKIGLPTFLRFNLQLTKSIIWHWKTTWAKML